MRRVDNSDYFSRPEMSNSALSVIAQKLSGKQPYRLPKEALLFGSAVDSILTGNDIGGRGSMPDGVDLALVSNVVDSFLSDSTNLFIVHKWDKQAAFVGTISFMCDGLGLGIDELELSIESKILCDFYDASANAICDLKTTSATTYDQWLKSIDAFKYYRQAAWYMDTLGSNSFALRGVSKIYPYKLFNTTIERGDALYKKGYDEYRYILACKYLADEGVPCFSDLL